jgi:DNA primase
MNSVVQDIKDRINLVDLIGEYVRTQKAGANWKALCPFHHEKTPSFMINDEKQIWHCFGCGKGGDVFGFLMEIEGVDFKEALKILADKAGVELPKFSKEQAEFADDKKKALEILELATKFYEKQLWDGMGKEKIETNL